MLKAVNGIVMSMMASKVLHESDYFQLNATVLAIWNLCTRIIYSLNLKWWVYVPTFLAINPRTCTDAGCMASTRWYVRYVWGLYHFLLAQILSSGIVFIENFRVVLYFMLELWIALQDGTRTTHAAAVSGALSGIFWWWRIRRGKTKKTIEKWGWHLILFTVVRCHFAEVRDCHAREIFLEFLITASCSSCSK